MMYSGGLVSLNNKARTYLVYNRERKAREGNRGEKVYVCMFLLLFFCGEWKSIGCCFE
jgi:hypothetical protein